MANFDLERGLFNEGFSAVAGVDEAGRGPLAGPVYVAAVIMPDDTENVGINDSKKLSEKKREELYDLIIERAVSYSIVSVSARDIDRMNILAATMSGMKRAVESLSPPADFALVDGNRLPDLSVPARYVIKGDSLSVSIAAASILAKVSRDRYMKVLDETYPQYLFAKHKGYPTALHYEMIKEYGPCPEHRVSFLKTLDRH